MAWNLQPFVGDRGQAFKLFRHNEGNFYTAVVYSLQKIAHGEGKSAPPGPEPTLFGGWHVPPSPPGPDSSGAHAR